MTIHLEMPDRPEGEWRSVLERTITEKVLSFLAERPIKEEVGHAFQPFLYQGWHISPLYRRSVRVDKDRWEHEVHVVVKEL